MKISKMAKMGGAGLVAFCAASVLADKVNLNPALAQTAGFLGGFLGSLIASRKNRKDEKDEPLDPPVSGNREDPG